MLLSNVTHAKDPINTLGRSYKKISEVLKINNSKMRQLKISSSVKNAIINFCQRNGLLCSWNELLSVKGITVLPLQKAYQSTVNIERKEPVKGRKALYKRVNPLPIPELIKNETKVMGLHIRQNLLCWAIVQGDSTIRDWNCRHLSEQMPVESLYEIVKLASPIPDSLEVCDVYVMEEPRSMKVTNRKMIHLKTQLGHMYAILMTLFLQQKTTVQMPKDISNVYIMRSGTTAQHFDLKIGNDIVTTNYVIDPMLAKIRTDTPWKSQYVSKPKWEREEMSWALLNTLAFLDVCKSIAAKKNQIKKISGVNS